jgi:probable F420-dependent oxidoreductase
MKLWQLVLFEDPEQLLDIARAAESLGFHGIALCDHIVLPGRRDTVHPYDGVFEPDDPYLEPWAAISAMAAVTERLHFTTYVYVLPLREPFTVAKAVGTAAILSRGRVALGVGTGWLREEFDFVGSPFADRGARSDEMLEIVRQLLATGRVSHHGRHHRIDDASMYPVPRQPVPVWVGGTSPPALRRAARADGWLGLEHTDDELARIVAVLDDELARNGRTREGFEIMALPSRDPDVDAYRRAARLGVTSGVVTSWCLQGPATALPRTAPVDEKIDVMRQWTEALGVVSSP